MPGFGSVRVRIIQDSVWKAAIIFASLLCALPLFFILFYIIKNGISSISWDFFFNLPAPVGEAGGGISNAIIGTALLTLIACVLSVPLGVSVGIYLAEHKGTKFSNLVRLCVEVLQGIPSIVIGIVAYAWIVLMVGTFSAFSGGVALALMMLPIIVRSTEETLLVLPYSLKEASLALGVPYYRTILRVVLPAGASGIVTGILLSIARIAGETAPLLFTAFGNPFMNYNILKPVNSLPLLIFNYATSPYEEWHSIAWGASFVLIAIVLILNFLTKLVMRKWKVQF